MVVPTQNPIGSAAWRRVPVSAAASFFGAVCDTARGTSTNIIARNPPNFFMTSVIPSLVTYGPFNTATILAAGASEWALQENYSLDLRGSLHRNRTRRLVQCQR